MDSTPRHDIEDRAFNFARRIVPYTDVLVRRGGVAALLGRQLARAGTSIGANLEEATGAQSRADFIARTTVAFKEARECRYWIRLIEATMNSLPAGGEPLRQEACELIAILTAILKNAKRNAGRRV